MSIKFGLMNHPRENILKEIELVRKLGFDFVEITMEWPGASPEILIKNKNKILNLLSKFKSKPIAHTWYIDLGSSYEHVRKGGISEAKKMIGIASLLKIDLINFHFYSSGLRPSLVKYRKEILTNIINSFKEIVRYAKSKKVKVMTENLAAHSEVTDFNDFKFVIDRVPNLKVHLDIGHAFIQHGMEGVKNYMFTFKDSLAHIHVSDNDGEEDEHLPLGKGKINFEQVAKWLKQVNYDKTITFEVFTSKEDAKESMLKFKKMLDAK